MEEEVCVVDLLGAESEHAAAARPGGGGASGEALQAAHPGSAGGASESGAWAEAAPAVGAAGGGSAGGAVPSKPACEREPAWADISSRVGGLMESARKKDAELAKCREETQLLKGKLEGVESRAQEAEARAAAKYQDEIQRLKGELEAVRAEETKWKKTIADMFGS